MDDNKMKMVASESMENTAKEILRVSQDLDPAMLSKIVGLLVSCKSKVLVSGIGTSGVAARKIAHSLSCLEIPTIYLSPGDAVHGASGMITPGDVLFLISKGGVSQEINKLIPIAHARGAQVVAVTERGDTELALNSDFVFLITIERESDQVGLLATASTLAVMATFDAICSIIMSEKGFSADGFLTIHPGGDVGRKLRKKV